MLTLLLAQSAAAPAPAPSPGSTAHLYAFDDFTLVGASPQVDGTTVLPALDLIMVEMTSDPGAGARAWRSGTNEVSISSDRQATTRVHFWRLHSILR